MGTIMVITASFISCFGVNLQKWAHNKNKELPLHERRPMISNWRWWLGFICMVLGSLFDMAALPFVPQSRVAALGATGIVANVIITPLFLGEKLTKHDLIGCGVVCVGCTLATVFGAATEPDIDSTCLLSYFEAGSFIAYAMILITCLCILFYFIRGFQLVERMVIAGKHCPNDNFDCVWAAENEETCLKYADDRIYPFVYITRWGAPFYPFIVAAFAGAAGANSIMFAKAVLIFLKNAAKGNATSAGYLCAFLIPFGGCLFLQITYMNKALHIYPDALFVLPIYQSFWIVLGIAAGLIFYKEYQQLSGLEIFLFSLGVITSLIGVQILSMRDTGDGPDGSNYDLAKPEFTAHRTLTRDNSFADDYGGHMELEGTGSYKPPQVYLDMKHDETAENGAPNRSTQQDTDITHSPLASPQKRDSGGSSSSNTMRAGLLDHADHNSTPQYQWSE